MAPCTSATARRSISSATIAGAYSSIIRRVPWTWCNRPAHTRMRSTSSGAWEKASISSRACRRVSSSSGLIQPRVVVSIASRITVIVHPRRPGGRAPALHPGGSACSSVDPPSPSGRQLEVRHRATQVGGELREVANRLCGLVGALAGLRGDLLDRAHGAGDVGRRTGLLLRRLRNALDEAGQV